VTEMAEQPEESHVLLELEESVAWIRLNRPDRLNPIGSLARRLALDRRRPLLPFELRAVGDVVAHGWIIRKGRSPQRPSVLRLDRS